LYVSNDTGQTWQKVFDITDSAGTIQSSTQTILRVATGPGGAVAVAVINLGIGTSGQLTGVFWSTSPSTTPSSWTHFTMTPNVNTITQGGVNTAIAIDPNNKNFVYVSGDESATSTFFGVSAFRLNAANSTAAATSITDGNTANNSTVHSDSRFITFD